MNTIHLLIKKQDDLCVSMISGEARGLGSGILEPKPGLSVRPWSPAGRSTFRSGDGTRRDESRPGRFQGHLVKPLLREPDRLDCPSPPPLLSDGHLGSEALRSCRARVGKGAGEEGWAPSPGNALGAGLCVTEVRPSPGLSRHHRQV